MNTSIRPFLTGLAFVVCAAHINAQNLVPNPGFEDHIDCANGVYWNGLLDWDTPNCAWLTDYFTACNNASGNGFGVPDNLYGIQEAHGGEGYGGFLAYVKHFSSHQSRITTHLTAPLQGDQTYCIRFWLSVVEESECRCNFLHGLFTDEMPTVCNNADSAWATLAQVQFNTSVTDTLTWVQVEAQYTASGGEEYFTFGNFLPDTLTDVTYYGPNLVNSVSAFFVDDFYLGPCDVGIKDGDPQQQKISAWPNPANELLHVRSSAYEPNASVTVLDSRGQVVLTEQLVGSTLDVDISVLAAGYYSLRIATTKNVSLAQFSVVRP